MGISGGGGRWGSEGCHVRGIEKRGVLEFLTLERRGDGAVVGKEVC